MLVLNIYFPSRCSFNFKLVDRINLFCELTQMPPQTVLYWTKSTTSSLLGAWVGLDTLCSKIWALCFWASSSKQQHYAWNYAQKVSLWTTDLGFIWCPFLCLKTEKYFCKPETQYRIKWWRHKNKISVIMGFVRIFSKNNVQEAYLPKMSISGQIVSEMLGADLGGGCRGCVPPPPLLKWLAVF